MTELDDSMIDFLEAGYAELPYSIDDVAKERIKKYLLLLNKWNQIHNLTAIRDVKTQITHHFLDCLAIMPFLSKDQFIADIGSGAGFPGMMIALIYPEKTIFTVESNGKKAAFLRTLKRELKLGNVQVVNARVENWHSEIKMDAIISRAVSDIDMFLSLTKHLGKAEARWLLMKAKIDEVCHDADFNIQAVDVLKVPYLDAQRNLVTIQRKQAI